MRKYLLFFLILLCPFCSNAQKMADDYYNETLIAFVNKDYGNAIEGCKYLQQHYPEYAKMYGVNHSIGFAYLLHGDYDSAIVVRKTQLKDTSAEYASYKNATALDIYEAYKGLKQYDSALYYLHLADTLYIYYGSAGCGNDMEDEAWRRSMKMKDLYLLMGDTTNAEGILLKTILLSYNSPGRFDELKPFLLRHGDVSKLKKDFKAAMKVNHNEQHRRDMMTRSNYIVFMGYKMYWGNWDQHMVNVEAGIKQTMFYRMLMALPDKMPANK